MGATVSICNYTSFFLNIALRHAAPVHYMNMVPPGTCWTPTVGQVWFTLEAKFWLFGINDYDDAQVALPIAAAALLTPVAGAVAIGGPLVSDKQPLREPAIVAAVAAAPGAILGAAGISVNVDHTPKMLKVSKLGVYMKPGRVINITGGLDITSMATSILNARFEKYKIQIVK